MTIDLGKKRLETWNEKPVRGIGSCTNSNLNLGRLRKYDSNSNWNPS